MIPDPDPYKPLVMVEASIECPRCAERIKARAQVCRFCGHELYEDSPRRRGRTPSSRRVEVVHHYATTPQKANPGIAALLSFLLTGAGQMYAGHVWRGIAMFFGVPTAAVIFALMVSPLAGYAVGALLWFVNVFDAVLCASMEPSVGVAPERPTYRGRR